MNDSPKVTARLASLDQLLENIVPAYFAPPPGKATLRSSFDSAKVPRFKSNPTCKRGGGIVFYSVAHVEKFFKSFTVPPAGGVA